MAKILKKEVTINRCTECDFFSMIELTHPICTNKGNKSYNHAKLFKRKINVSHNIAIDKNCILEDAKEE